MLAEQISVFLENKAGRLAEVARVLADMGINIRALSIADTSDFGVLRLIVSDAEKADRALKRTGWTVRRTRVAAVEVRDEPGGLLKILDLMDSVGINIEYMYAFANPNPGQAIMIFRFDPMDDAIDALKEKGMRLVPGPDLVAI